MKGQKGSVAAICNTNSNIDRYCSEYHLTKLVYEIEIFISWKLAGFVPLEYLTKRVILSK